MMSEQTMRQYNFNGEMVAGTPAPLTMQPGEPWVEYMLNDGTVMRLKLVLFEAVRLEGKFEPDGTPCYYTKTMVLQHVSAPESLRKTS